MAKTKVSQWDSVAANNTDINSININEGCPPSTINNAIRELMKEIKDWQDGSSGDGWTSSGTVTASGTLVSSGTLSVTGNLTLDGASGTSGQFLTSAGTGTTPSWTTAFVSGMIMLWSGSEASIPSGWLLCDGTSSTPDLRNKFVVGASAGTGDTTYPGLSVGATGGSATAVVVSHSHTATSSVSDPGHLHSLPKDVSGGSNIPTLTDNPNADEGWTTNPGTGAAATGISVSTSVASNGVSGTNANLPPYYALAYIMKS